MIVVTGCRRSGTSMWMQMLQAAGLPIVGEAFAPELEALHEANPRGFFESEHRYGLEGDAEELEGQVVKMFAPGVVEVDEDDLERVILSIRPWREHVASAEKFEALEAEALGIPVPQSMPADLEWWFENYVLFGDFSARDYPMMVVAYDLVLEKPRETAERALVFLDVDEEEAAALAPKVAAVVDPALRRADPAEASSELPAVALATFDALYERIREREPFDDAFVDRLGATHELLWPSIRPYLEED
jgi:hypothetical protein